jgi:hypothetical protein
MGKGAKPASAMTSKTCVMAWKTCISHDIKDLHQPGLQSLNHLILTYMHGIPLPQFSNISFILHNFCTQWNYWCGRHLRVSFLYKTPSSCYPRCRNVVQINGTEKQSRPNFVDKPNIAFNSLGSKNRVLNCHCARKRGTDIFLIPLERVLKFAFNFEASTSGWTLQSARSLESWDPNASSVGHSFMCSGLGFGISNLNLQVWLVIYNLNVKLPEHNFFTFKSSTLQSGALLTVAFLNFTF